MYLYHLVYFSKRKSISDAAFAEILNTSRRNNVALAITGALFMNDAYYFQVLEGPRSALSELLSAIFQDTRHEQVVLALFEPVDQRMFGSWSMAELPATDPVVQALFHRYMNEVDTPTMMSGGMIWDMIGAMADASAGHLAAQMSA